MDIGKIVIEIDANDNGFTAKIQGATAAVEKMGAAATTHLGNTANGLDKATVKVEAFKGKMEQLTTVLLGAGFLETAHRALALSDSISDLSKGTDVSIPKILQLREAFESNGGSAEGLGKVLSKLSNYLQEARDGSKAAQESLLKLGLTFSDMANMDTAEALTKVIEKLANMTDAVERNAMAVRIFGKEAKNIDWAGVREGTSSSTDEYNKYAKAIEDAGKAHDKLAAASEKLLIAFTNLLEKTGVLKFINEMSDSMEKFERIVTVAGAAFATYFGAKAVIMVVEFASALKKIELGILAIFGAEQLLEKGTIIGRIASLAVGLLAAAGIYMGASKLLEEAMKPAEGETKPTTPEADTPKKKRPPVTPAWAGEIAQINQLSDAFEKLTNTEAAKFRQDTALIGSSADAAEKTKYLSELTQKYNDKIDEILSKEEALRAGRNAGNAGETGAKLAAYAKERAEITATYDLAFAARAKDADGRAKANQLQRDTLELIAQENSLRDRMTDIANQTAMLGLDPIARQYLAIEQNARKAAQAEIDAENKRRGTEAGPMSKEAEQSYFDRQSRIAAREKDALAGYLHNANSFETGWKEAFNSYYENATNASKMAQNSFAAVMSGMDNAIDKFVMTGKFAFGDFARSVIQDLLKIQLKAAAMNFLKASGFSNLFGFFADGGDPPVGQASIVGERGPELFVPKTPGTIIPHEKIGLGGGGTTHNQYITNNITAVDAKSVAQLFYENRQTLFGTVEMAKKELPFRGVTA